MRSRALVARLTEAFAFDFTAAEALLRLHEGTGSIREWLATSFAAEYAAGCSLPWRPLDEATLQAELERALLRLPPELPMPEPQFDPFRIDDPRLWQLRLHHLRQETALRRQIASHVACYAPARAGLAIRYTLPLPVYFHLGGCWGARISGGIWVNLKFFARGDRINLEDLGGPFAQELLHHVARSLEPKGELPLPVRALWQIECQGLALLCGLSYRGALLPEENAVQWWREQISLLDQIAALAEDRHGMVGHMRMGQDAANAYGHLGCAIAALIERRLGRGALRDSFSQGPAGFFRRAAALAAADGSLPGPGPDALRLLQEVPAWA
jgi:hypothetical protein